jgi:predicted DNA-binding protein (UPF0251 family)
MPRKKCKRQINYTPGVTYYKPAGIPRRELEEIVLEADEIEAIRLANLEEMYQEEAAVKMGISRQTFGRIITSANKKVAEGLINGKSIRLNTN